MRIAITRREALDIPDGINRFIWAIYDCLVSAGHEVLAVSPCHSSIGRISEFFGLEHKPIRLATLSSQPALHHGGILAAWLRKGLKTLREYQPNFVILNGALPFKLGASSVLVVHDVEARWGYGTLGRRVYKAYAYRLAGRIVATCEEIRTALRGEAWIGPDRVTVIPTCVRLSDYRPRPLAERRNAILHIGTAPYKNPCATVEALKEMPSGTILYVVGVATDELKRCISRQPSALQGQIRVLGNVTFGELCELLGRVRVVAVPSTYRVPVCSPTVLEALASGTPVVASDSISADVISSGQNGYRIPLSHTQEFRQALARLLLDSCVWNSLSEGALRSAKSFSHMAIAERYLKLAQTCE